MQEIPININNMNIVFVGFTPYHLFISKLLSNVIRQYTVSDCQVSYVLHERLRETIKHLHIDQQLEKIVWFSDVSVSRTKGSSFSWIKDKLHIRKNIGKITDAICEPNILFLFSDNYIYSQALSCKWDKCYKILIEEGIGIYRTSNEFDIAETNIAVRKMKEWILSLVYGFRFQRVGHGYVDEISAFFVRNPELLPKDKLKNKLVIKLCTEQLYQASGFEEICKTNNDVSISENGFLFLSQCLSEDNLLHVDNELSFYKVLSQKLKNENRKLYIKPHPRESLKKLRLLEKYGQVLYEYQYVPIELSVSLIKQCSEVGTFISSAIMNLAGFYPNKNFYIMSNLAGLEVDSVVDVSYFQNLSNVKILNDWHNI